MNDSGSNSRWREHGNETWIDNICDRFEDRCRSGNTPIIGAFLEEHWISVENASPDLFEQLRKIEAAYLPANPNEPTPSPGPASDAMPTGSFPMISGTKDPFVTGTTIGGRFRLQEKIGTGGMGIVWRATQIEPVRREVALKLIREAIDSKSVLARFDAERQALAMMDHPNIARVFDGGTTSAGQPFFVMELVEGISITEFCDRRELPIKDRLELFVMVCHAVQHAHQKGIIHRDIKPGNVLVTETDGKPTPKVIDFGVAKAVEVELTNLSLAETCLVGTPAYMSPEQADLAARDIDTRSDIYSLGALLYELLTGSPPLEPGTLKRGALQEMLRLVREAEPLKPSARIDSLGDASSVAAKRLSDPERLKRALRGDLDWITLKALDKERGRRYDTANDFAADIVRHLQNEPVQAAPPGKLYLAGKFIRKNRGLVVATSLIFGAMLAGMTGILVGFMQAQASEAAALIAESQANAKANELRYMLGLTNIILANVAYENGDVVLANQRLESVPVEQRGWEWKYLERQIKGGIFTIESSEGVVNCLAYSPDGKQFVSGGEQGVLRLWNARTGIMESTINSHDSPIAHVHFSNNGSYLVSDDGRTEKTWDRAAGKLIEEKPSASRDPAILAISPDGRWRISNDQPIIFESKTGKPVLTLDEKHGAFKLKFAVFSGDRIGIICEHRNSKFIKVFDIGRGSEIASIEVNFDEFQNMGFSPDQTKIITYGHGAVAKIWDIRTGNILNMLRGHTDSLTAATFSPDGRFVAMSSKDGTMKIWDASTGVPESELNNEEGMVFAGAYDQTGSRILTGSFKGVTAKVWDAQTGEKLIGFNEVVDDLVVGWRFSPNASHALLMKGRNESSTSLWDAVRGKRVYEIANGESAEFSNDGDQIIVLLRDRPQVKTENEEIEWSLCWQETSSGRELSRMKLPGPGSWMRRSADGTRLLIGGPNCDTYLIDADAQKILFAIPKTDGQRNEIGEQVRSGKSNGALNHDGKRILTLDQDGMARIWNANTGTVITKFQAYARHDKIGPSIGAIFSPDNGPDNDRVLTGGLTPTVWDCRTGTPLLELKSRSGQVFGLAFSPDGTKLLTGCNGGRPKIWDARSSVPIEKHGSIDPDELSYRLFHTRPKR